MNTDVSPKLPADPAWPRTGGWPAATGTAADMAIVGIPVSQTSLSPTGAHETPAAIRATLRRYSSHVVDSGSQAAPGAARGAEREWVLDELLTIVDGGDAVDPDSIAGEAAATELVARLAQQARLVVALGGDNSLTVPAALGVFGDDLDTAGLITIDAHHDLRDGRSNGSPVRRLIEAGLDPARIVQIGIADFANSAEYRRRAKEYGITVIHRDELHTRSLESVVAAALAVAGSAGGPVHVDLDVDVCDRSVAPGCPASIPGGIAAYELRRMARLLAADERVRGVDIAEVDATADTADMRTVRLAALCVLEIAAGLAQRA